MNKTKRRILDESRNLFNLYGISNVSQRRISDQLGISPGNLTYHFNKSDDIVEALYFELVAHMNTATEQVKGLNYDLTFMFRLIDSLVDSFFEYRFIFLDFVQIMRNHERIRNHFEQLTALRKRQFEEAIQCLTSTNILRHEELPNEYDFLYDRFQILADFWISSIETRESGVKTEHLERIKKVLVQAIYPHLTRQGKETFLSIYRS